MRNRLSVPSDEAEARIDRLIADGERLLSEAEDVATQETWVEWTRALERWQQLGKGALATTFEGTDEADEFFSAATGRIVRQWGGQSDNETFAYQKEAIANGINTLLSLKDRLEYAAPPPDTGTEPLAVAAKADVTADKVFVVHGRNTVARDGMFDFLRAIGLHPIDWSEAVHSLGRDRRTSERCSTLHLPRRRPSLCS